jgi:hypothetical protein
MRRYNYRRGAEIYVPCAHQVMTTYYQPEPVASIVINDHNLCLTSAHRLRFWTTLLFLRAR